MDISEIPGKYYHLGHGEPISDMHNDLLPIPSRILSALERYVREGIKPGGFLTAIIDNDLRMAITMADPEAERAIPAIVRVMAEYVPALAWGSPTIRELWSVRGGITRRHSGRL